MNFYKLLSIFTIHMILISDGQHYASNNNNNEKNDDINTDTFNAKQFNNKAKIKIRSQKGQKPNLKFKNLVLEGGGSKALSHIGALKAFKELGYYNKYNKYVFEKISGTSTGCFMAFILALDIDPESIENLIYKHDVISELLDFNSNILKSDEFQTNPDDESNLNWFKKMSNSYNLVSHTSQILELWLNKQTPGLSTSKNFTSFINDEIITLSPYYKVLTAHNLTFNHIYQLSGHQLSCFATQLSKNELIEYSLAKTPNEFVINSIYASMTIPGIFKPISTLNGDPLIDGSLIDSLPITIYDELDKISTDTIGLSIRHQPTEREQIKCVDFHRQYNIRTSLDHNDGTNEMYNDYDSSWNIESIENENIFNVDSRETCSNDDKNTDDCLIDVYHADENNENDGIANKYNPNAENNDGVDEDDNNVSDMKIKTSKHYIVDNDFDQKNDARANKVLEPTTTLPYKVGSSASDQQHHRQHQRETIDSQFLEVQNLSTYGYIAMLHSLIVDQNAQKYICNPHNNDRIIYLNSPIKLLDFNIDIRLISLAINQAYINTITFLK